jgi:hypothetical protein
MRPIGCWDCGFESHGGHECLCLVNVVCCQVEVSASGWSLVQRSPTDCAASECDCKALDNEDASAHYGMSRHGEGCVGRIRTATTSNKKIKRDASVLWMLPIVTVHSESATWKWTVTEEHGCIWQFQFTASRQRRSIPYIGMEPTLKWLVLRSIRMAVVGKGKVHPCTTTEALYRPYGP